MDRIWVCGTHDVGSIPAESTDKKIPHSEWGIFFGCFWIWGSNRGDFLEPNEPH